LTAVFLVIDLAFFAANIVKIPDGGWFPLAVGAFVFTLLTTWKAGRRRLAKEIKRGELPVERFIGSIATHPQIRVPGTGVYMFPEPGTTPPALLANLRHNKVLHKTVVLVSVRTAGRPKVHRAERVTLHPLGERFFQVVLLFGFMEEPNVPQELESIVDTELGIHSEETTYFLGRESVVHSPGGGWRGWRTGLFSFMYRNATSAGQYFGLDTNRVVELGARVKM